MREASSERRLLEQLAPGLVSSVPFVLPVYESNWDSIKYRAGLTLYDLVAGFQNTARHRRLPDHEIDTHYPGLRRGALKAAYRYFDAVTDDARLTIQVAKVAASLGAVCANHASVNALIRRSGRTVGAIATDTVGGGDIEIKARKVVLAGGVWLDKLLAFDVPGMAHNMSPARGIHIVLPGNGLPAETAFAMTVPADGRLVFAIPWFHRTLVGTTDTPYDGDLDQPPFQIEEVDYLLDVVNHHFPENNFTRADVVAVQAGLRPLLSQPGQDVEDLSRRDRLIHTPSGVLAVGGGKLTTYRRIASKTVDAVIRDLEQQGRRFPGAELSTDQIPLNRRIDDKPPAHASGVSGLAAGDYLTWAYGADASQLSRSDVESSESGARLLPGRPYVPAEIDYSVRREMAVNVSDFMSQRLRCLLIDDAHGTACASRVATIMGNQLGWDDEERKRQVDNYHALAARHSLSPDVAPDRPAPEQTPPIPPS